MELSSDNLLEYLLRGAWQLCFVYHAGKVLHFYVIYALISNFNMYNNFSLQETVDRYILLWNEPVLEFSAEKTLKCFFSGYNVNCKIQR